MRLSFLFVNNTYLHPTSHRFHVIGLIFAFDRRIPLFDTLILDKPPKLKTTKFGLKNQKHRPIVWCEIYFDTLNRLSVDHECDRRTDRQNCLSNDAR